MGVELTVQSNIPKHKKTSSLSSPSHTSPPCYRQHTVPVMNLYLVLLLSVLSLCPSALSVGGQDPPEEELIIVRHIKPLGDWATVNTNQKDVQDAAKEAEKEFNTKSKAKKYFKLVDVTSAQMKVTDVINYKIDATLGKTKCLKTKPANLDSCDMAQKRLKCKFMVRFNPRNDRYMVKPMSCHK